MEFQRPYYLCTGQNVLERTGHEIRVNVFFKALQIPCSRLLAKSTRKFQIEIFLVSKELMLGYLKTKFSHTLWSIWRLISLIQSVSIGKMVGVDNILPHSDPHIQYRATVFISLESARQAESIGVGLMSEPHKGVLPGPFTFSRS